jgi:hypothetical protein
LRQGYYLGDVQAGGAGAAAQPGDEVTALVNLASFDGTFSPEQWIIRLRLARQETGAKPGGRTRDVTYYTNAGDVFAFHTAVTPMDLETVGPVRSGTPAGADVAAKRARIGVSTDYLTLNLGRTAKVLITLKENSEKNSGRHYDLSAGPTLFPRAGWAANRRNLDDLGLTEGDRRSFTGSLPALSQFLDIVRGTPGLQEILLKVLDKPSLIDVFRHGARADVSFEFVGADLPPAGKPGGRELFWTDGAEREFGFLAFSLMVFGKPVLNVGLFVTQPRPPLEVCAGILGLVAWSPSRADKVVVVRVQSSRPGVAPATKW